jgi:sugar phosphate isomerase/epimerase
MLHAEGDTWHPSWIEPDPGLRERRILHTGNCIDLAARLGARTLSTEPGGPLNGMAPNEALELFIEGLKRVEGRAKDQGVRILIEPEPGLLVENSFQFRGLLKHLDPEVFGLNFDIGHFFCVGEDPVRLVREMGSVTHHFHLEDIAATREHCHLMLGEGAMDIPSVLDAISDTGYQGFVTVELYPYENRPVDAAKKAFAYLRNWMDRGR